MALEDEADHVAAGMCGPRLRSRSARPSISTSPESGCSRPPIIASSVLLAEPERPVITIASPAAIDSDVAQRGDAAEALPDALDGDGRAARRARPVTWTG